MTEQGVDLSDPGVLRRTAEPLAAHYAGVFFPELVERCVARAHAELSCTARIQTYLVPMAMRLAREHLRALAAARTGHGSADTAPDAAPNAAEVSPVHQVLFVDEEDTGRSQIAAALLAHYAGELTVTRSAGVVAGEAVDPLVAEVLSERGVAVGLLYPKPVTDDVVRAADRVVTFGAHNGIRIHSGPVQEHWVVGGLFPGTGPGRAWEIADAIDARVKGLWEQICADDDRAAAVADSGAG